MKTDTTVCQTCHGQAWLLHVYSRGPNSPPGNQRVGCPDCDAGRKYTAEIERVVADAMAQQRFNVHE